MLHPDALWTWDDLQRASMQLERLAVTNVDMGGAIEWLAKGLRTHKNLRTLDLSGCCLGVAGARCLGNAMAENLSIQELRVDRCGFHDRGLDAFLTPLEKLEV